MHHISLNIGNKARDNTCTLPEEDGHIESYFSRFKDDYIYTKEYTSFEAFRGYIE